MYPYFTNGIISCGENDQQKLAPLVLLQTKIIKILASAKWCSHTSTLYKDMAILKVRDIYELNVISFMHNLRQTRYTPPPYRQSLDIETHMVYLDQRDAYMKDEFSFTGRYCTVPFQILLKIIVQLKD